MLKNKVIKERGRRLMKMILIIHFVFFNSIMSFSQWTNNTSINTLICNSINDQKNYSVASDSKGGAFIIWTDNRNNLLKADIYAQRIDSLGYTLWTNNGIGVCTSIADQSNPSTTEDGNGGVIIAWDDSTNGDRDIYAQKLYSLGNPKWAINGVSIVVKPNKQKSVKIVSDGAGGAIAVWEDSSAGYWDIYAQRINSNGIAMWQTYGVPVCIAALNQKNARLVSDGTGGAYIVWQDKRSGVDYDIYLQHLNSLGQPLLAVDGISICNVIDKQTDPKIVSDKLGGAIVTWPDKRGGISYDVYAQRISSTGLLLWTVNGVSICSADSSQTSIDITSDNISGAIITWRDKRNGLYHDIYAQKINMTGNVAWQLNGIKISNSALTQSNPNICGDDNGGAIITWQDSTIGNWNIRSQRVNASGVALWGSGGIIVSNANNIQTNPKNISDGKGGCIFVWQDFRNGLNDDIYCQHLTAVGIQEINNNCISQNNIVLYPNPMSESASIKFLDENISINLCSGYIYDIYGKEISRFNIVNSNSKMNVKEFSAGIYFLKITEKGKIIFNTKFVIVK